MESEIALLLEGLDEAFDKQSWHGPNLRGSIRGVTAEQAAWRPGPDRHNIWELALHCAYWKYVVRRKLTAEKRGSFVLPGSNFFKRPEELSEAAWKKDIDILEEEHRKLRGVIAGLTLLGPKRNATLQLIRGAAAHDLYHAGQIRLLRRLIPAMLPRGLKAASARDRSA
ncbi:MAG: DinB family protein [Bryobacterales bacterium]|nr:DinB family protein [Bryobacterales bacterium]MBV9396506.1 DinB family protein [Bryobacterales bacterium]